MVVVRTEMQAARMDMKRIKGDNEEYEEMHKKYIEALQYYQSVFSKAYTLTKDLTLALKKGTLVIPPVEQPKEGA